MSPTEGSCHCHEEPPQGEKEHKVEAIPVLMASMPYSVLQPPFLLKLRFTPRAICENTLRGIEYADLLLFAMRNGFLGVDTLISDKCSKLITGKFSLIRMLTVFDTGRLVFLCIKLQR